MAVPRIGADEDVGDTMTLMPLKSENFHALRSQYMSRYIKPGSETAAYGVLVDGKLNVLCRNMTLLAEGWIDTAADKAWVPIETVIGRNKIPASAAKAIRKALDKMVGSQEISSKELWKGLEVMAERYVSGK